MSTSTIINPSATGATTIGTVTVDTITGSVSIDSPIEISNDTGNPIPVSGTVALSNTSLEISNDIGNPIPILSSSARVGVEITRPNDTTAYAAKDVISTSNTSGTLITFTNLSRANGSSGVIVRARLMTTQATNVSQYRLHLFHTAPTPINDNSPYLVQYTNANNRIGMIDFAAMTTEDASSNAAMTMRPSSDGAYPSPNLWFSTDPLDRNVYGMLETLSAFTPAANQKFYIELSAILD